MVTQDIFDQVQIAMGWKSKRVRNSTSGRSYAFKGPFICGSCGFNVTAYTKQKTLRRSGEEIEYIFYTCTKKSKVTKCKEPQISEAELRAQVIAELSKIAINRDEAKDCFQLLRNYHDEQVNNRNTMLDVWQKDSKEAREKLDRLLQMRLDGESIQIHLRSIKIVRKIYWLEPKN